MLRDQKSRSELPPRVFDEEKHILAAGSVHIGEGLIQKSESGTADKGLC